MTVDGEDAISVNSVNLPNKKITISILYHINFKAIEPARAICYITRYPWLLTKKMCKYLMHLWIAAKVLNMAVKFSI